MAAPVIDIARKTNVRLAPYRHGHERSVALARPAAPGRDIRAAQAPIRDSSLPQLRLECVTAAGGVLPLWRDFEARVFGTLYQSAAWCQAWLETVGSAWGAKPRIVLAFDTGGQLRFILPLQVRRCQGVRVLEWLGSPHHNYGFGLFEPGFLSSAEGWFAANWNHVLEATGKWDAVSLTQMPDRLLGRRNPMRPVFNIRGANVSFLMRLEPDFDALYRRKRSSERRRTARKSEAALAERGEIGFGLPKDPAAAHALIDTMFEHQQQRLSELGIHGVFGPVERQFIHRLADLQDNDKPILAPYHLTCGGEILSVMLGGIHANGYWALISSLAAGPHRRHSPGDHALRRTIAACCERELNYFDFSAGDSSYKRQWSDEIIDLYHCLRARNLKGLAWCSAIAFRIAIKRMVKRTPILLEASQNLRKLIFGKR